MYRRYLYSALFLSVLLFAMHGAAIKYYLYWAVWWYDIPVHVIGGAIFGASAIWFFGSLKERTSRISDSSLIAFSLTAVFIVGVFWEVYEYVFEMAYNPAIGYALDTVKDMFMDLGGASVALWFYKRQKLSVAAIHEQ